MRRGGGAGEWPGPQWFALRRAGGGATHLLKCGEDLIAVAQPGDPQFLQVGIRQRQQRLRINPVRLE